MTLGRGDIGIVSIHRKHAAGKHDPFHRATPFCGFQDISRTCPGRLDEFIFRIYGFGQQKRTGSMNNLFKTLHGFVETAAHKIGLEKLQCSSGVF